MTSPSRAFDARRLPGLLLALGLVGLWLADRLWLAGPVRLAVLAVGLVGAGLALWLRVGRWRAATVAERPAERWLLIGYLAVVAIATVYGLAREATRADLGAIPAWYGLAQALWLSMVAIALPTLIAAELAYGRVPAALEVEPRTVALAARRGLSFGLMLVTAVSLNVLASRRDARIDASYFRTTLASEGTRAMLQRFDGELRVLLFFRRDSDVLPRVQRYFADLADASGTSGRAAKVTTEVVDFDFEPALASTYRVRGNGHVLLLASTPQQAAAGSLPQSAPEPKSGVFKVGQGLAAARPQLRQLDGLFSRTLRQVVQRERRVLLTVGHGERNQVRQDRTAGARVTTLKKVLRRLHLQSANLGMATGLATGVPADAAAVIIMGPTEPFLPEEAASLASYVQGGGRLFVMLDPGVDVGLDGLFGDLGVVVLPGAVTSERDHMRRTHTLRDRVFIFSNRFEPHPAVKTARRYADEVTAVFLGAAALERGGTIASPMARSAKGAQVAFPLRSGAKAFRDLDGDYERDPDEPAEALGLMAAIELPGALPDASRSSGDRATDDRARAGRAVVIGDGDFMTDGLARNSGNLMVFVDALSWLLDDPMAVADVASESDVRIEHSQGRERLWFYLTTVCVPLPVALVGLWRRRRQRRREEQV